MNETPLYSRRGLARGTSDALESLSYITPATNSSLLSSSSPPPLRPPGPLPAQPQLQNSYHSPSPQGYHHCFSPDDGSPQAAEAEAPRRPLYMPAKTWRPQHARVPDSYYTTPSDSSGPQRERRRSVRRWQSDEPPLPLRRSAPRYGPPAAAPTEVSPGTPPHPYAEAAGVPGDSMTVREAHLPRHRSSYSSCESRARRGGQGDALGGEDERTWPQDLMATPRPLPRPRRTGEEEAAAAAAVPTEPHHYYARLRNPPAACPPYTTVDYEAALREEEEEGEEAQRGPGAAASLSPAPPDSYYSAVRWEEERRHAVLRRALAEARPLVTAACEARWAEIERLEGLMGERRRRPAGRPPSSSPSSSSLADAPSAGAAHCRHHFSAAAAPLPSPRWREVLAVEAAELQRHRETHERAWERLDRESGRLAAALDRLLLPSWREDGRTIAAAGVRRVTTSVANAAGDDTTPAAAVAAAALSPPPPPAIGGETTDRTRSRPPSSSLELSSSPAVSSRSVSEGGGGVALTGHEAPAPPEDGEEREGDILAPTPEAPPAAAVTHLVSSLRQPAEVIRSPPARSSRRPPLAAVAPAAPLSALAAVAVVPGTLHATEVVRAEAGAGAAGGRQRMGTSRDGGTPREHKEESNYELSRAGNRIEKEHSHSSSAYSEGEEEENFEQHRVGDGSRSASDGRPSSLSSETSSSLSLDFLDVAAAATAGDSSSGRHHRQPAPRTETASGPSRRPESEAETAEEAATHHSRHHPHHPHHHAAAPPPHSTSAHTDGDARSDYSRSENSDTYSDEEDDMRSDDDGHHRDRTHYAGRDDVNVDGGEETASSDGGASSASPPPYFPTHYGAVDLET